MLVLLVKSIDVYLVSLVVWFVRWIGNDVIKKWKWWGYFCFYLCKWVFFLYYVFVVWIVVSVMVKMILLIKVLWFRLLIGFFIFCSMGFM